MEKRGVFSYGAVNGSRVRSVHGNSSGFFAWIGIDETILTKGLPKLEPMQLVFYTVRFSPPMVDYLPNGLLEGGRHYRHGREYQRVCEDWSKGGKDFYKKSEFCMILGQEARTTRAGNNFSISIPYFLRGHLGKVALSGLDMRAFLDGNVHPEELERISGLFGSRNISVWSVPKGKRRLDDLTHEEALMGHHIVSEADILAYQARRIALGIEDEENKESSSLGIVPLLKDPRNLGIRYNGTTIDPKSIPTQDFRNDRLMGPKDLLSLCRDIAG